MGAPRAETTVGLRLSARGRLSGRQTTAAVDVSADARATLEGFAPATGRARWRFDAGHDVGLIDGRLIPAQPGPHALVRRGAGGRRVSLDLAAGARRAVAPSAAGWCRRIVIYNPDDG